MMLPLIFSLTLLINTKDSKPTPVVVPQVDLARYMGTWYEIARLPNRFQRECACTSATYSLRADGRVTVLNRCLTPEGKRLQAKGRAKVVDPISNAKLKVTFFWPFYGDYWILALDPAYRHVMVGTPNHRYLWILSRSPRLETKDLDPLLDQARAQGFDLTNLIRTPTCEPGQP